MPVVAFEVRSPAMLVAEQTKNVNEKGSVTGHSEGHYAYVMAGEDFVCTAALQHAPGSHGSEAASLHCANGAHGIVTIAQKRKFVQANFTLTDGTNGWIIFE